MTPATAAALGAAAGALLGRASSPAAAEVHAHWLQVQEPVLLDLNGPLHQ